MCVYSGIVPKELDLIPSKERNRGVVSCWCSELGNLHAGTFPACSALSPFMLVWALTALMGQAAISCRPFVCVLCLQSRAQKYGIRRSGGFCTVQPLNQSHQCFHMVSAAALKSCSFLSGS